MRQVIDCDTNPDPDTNTDTDTKPDPDSDTDTKPDPDPDPNSNPNPDPNAHLCGSVFTNVGTKELTDMLPLSIKAFDEQLDKVRVQCVGLEVRVRG